MHIQTAYSDIRFLGLLADSIDVEKARYMASMAEDALARYLGVIFRRTLSGETYALDTIPVSSIESSDGSVKGDFALSHSDGIGDMVYLKVDLDQERFTQEERDEIERFLKSLSGRELLKGYREGAGA